MIAYKYDDLKYYIGEVNCQIDPLESKIQGHEIYLLPANSTFEVPPKEKDGYKIKWNGESWEYEKIPEPEPEPEPTEDEKKALVRGVRNSYLQGTDFTQLDDAPFTEDEKEQYRQYRQYLRDYTEGPDWWESYPKTFNEWIGNENLENSSIGGG